MSIALTMDILFALQKVDDGLEAIETESSRHRRTLETETEKLSRAIAWTEAAAGEMKARRIRELGVEQKIAALRDRATRLEQKIYSVKNNKELSAIEAEQSKLASEISSQEEQLLEILVGLEDLNGKSEFARTEIVKMREKIEEKRVESERFEAEAVARRGSLQLVRKKLSSFLEPRTFKLYEEVRNRHAGKGIMAMIDETCPKCSFGIPKSLMASILTSDSPEACRECGMLLFWPHPIDKRNCADCARIVDPEDLTEVFSRGEPFTCDRCGKIHDPLGFGLENPGRPED